MQWNVVSRVLQTVMIPCGTRWARGHCYHLVWDTMGEGSLLPSAKQKYSKQASAGRQPTRQRTTKHNFRYYVRLHLRLDRQNTATPLTYFSCLYTSVYHTFRIFVEAKMPTGNNFDLQILHRPTSSFTDIFHTHTHTLFLTSSIYVL